MADEDVSPVEIPERYINLKINADGISWDSDMDVVEVTFWLQATVHRVLTRAFEEVEIGSAPQQQ